MKIFYVEPPSYNSYIALMDMESIFLTCPDCQNQIRQFTKDLNRIKVRVCSACGTSVNIKDNQKPHSQPN